MGTRRGRTAGGAAAGGALLAAGVTLLATLGACTNGSDDLVATPKPVSPPAATMVHIRDVRTGMCLDGDRLPSGGRVGYLEVLDCGVEHSGEVFAVIPEASGTVGVLPDGSRCWEDYEPYVGTAPDRSVNRIQALTATAEARAARPAPRGCVAVAHDRLTGSMRGSAR